LSKIELYSGTDRITISKTRLLKKQLSSISYPKKHYVVVYSDGKYPNVKPGDIQEVDEG
jgi:hypothetical protein